MTVRPPLAVANRYAAQARTLRAEWLVSLHEGLITFTDLVEYACTPDGRPLLRIGLMRLLSEQDGWNRTRAWDTINRTLAVLGDAPLTRAEAAKLTVQWLVDARAGERRILAFTDALDPKDALPWSGFPYAPADTGGRA